MALSRPTRNSKSSSAPTRTTEPSRSRRRKSGISAVLTTSIQRSLEARQSAKHELSVMREVLNSYLQGDFSVHVNEQSSSALFEIAVLLNKIIRRNDNIAKEISRVKSVVVEEGWLSVRADVKDYAGAWS